VPKGRSVDQVKKELEAERQALARATDELKEAVHDATDIGAKLKANLPVVAAGALGVGFFLAGGIGATARLLFRRGRE
jgi:hypothetical protein